MKQYIPQQLHPMARQVRQLYRRWFNPIYSVEQTFTALTNYPRYFADRYRYSRLPEVEPLLWLDSYPCLFDQTATTGIDPHYFYQAVWATEQIAKNKANYHVDIGSEVKFVALLTTHLPTLFIDIRPLQTKVANLTNLAGSILTLPLGENTVESLSCLHVAEHIGLGRYGDPLDTQGTKKAAMELARVLAVGGNLYFSLPIGKPRVCFNAHRIHSPQQIIGYFNKLTLVNFAAIDDNGNFHPSLNHEDMADADYGCGLFHFRK